MIELNAKTYFEQRQVLTKVVSYLDKRIQTLRAKNYENQPTLLFELKGLLYCTEHFNFEEEYRRRLEIQIENLENPPNFDPRTKFYNQDLATIIEGLIEHRKGIISFISEVV